ncbi:phage terminase small subunit [Seminibacterium arietis]|uniref:Phage terminase small subunit n=1 Tax=Seminibacterium arietis TaxID=1173502 RepID=A0ABW3I8I3_9PAST
MGMRDFQAKVKALEEINSNDTTTTASAVQKHSNDYKLLQVALETDVNKIHALPTLDQKIEQKRRYFLPKWLPYVEQYFEQGETYQNDILGYCIVYLFDVGELGRAIELAQKAEAQGQRLPEKFKSTLANFVADTVLKWTEQQHRQQQPQEPYFSQVFRLIFSRWTVHDIVKSKWLKMGGCLLIADKNGQPNAAKIDDAERLNIARLLFLKAFTLNEKIGVKNLINRCEMRLNVLVLTPSQNGNDTADNTLNRENVIERALTILTQAQGGRHV